MSTSITDARPYEPSFEEMVHDRPPRQDLVDLPRIDRPDLVFVQLANFRELSMTHVSIKPGRHHFPHFHPESHHAIYVLKGIGVMHMGDQLYPMAPGTFLLIPKGVPHYAESTQSMPLDYLQMLVPARS